jgi:hypothetical protein
MKLRTARLCLDCDEIHDAYRCPACTSESFAYITRWVPEPERPRRAGPTTSPEAEVYRELVKDEDERTPSRGRRILRKGVVGLAAVGMLGWLWRGQDAERASRAPKAADPAEPTE